MPPPSLTALASSLRTSTECFGPTLALLVGTPSSPDSANVCEFLPLSRDWPHTAWQIVKVNYALWRPSTTPSPFISPESTPVQHRLAALTLTSLFLSPVLEAYRSGVAFAKTPGFMQQAVTRAEYLEMGSNASRRKFRDWKPAPVETNKAPEQSSRKGPARSQRMDREESPPLARKPSRGRGRGRATTTRR